MSKHRQRVQFRRKIAARNANKTSDALMDIYRRATQGGSGAYLTVNQESEPDRIAKIQVEAQERRNGRPKKVRVFRPIKSRLVEPKSTQPDQYRRLPSGQIVGHPTPMREVKQEARQSRLRRRAAFRTTKQPTVTAL